MSELSMALGEAGAPHRITHKDKTYTFGLFTKKRQDDFEKRLYQNAREGVYVDREHMDPVQYVERLDRVREAYEAGEYSFFGAKAEKLLQTQKGILLLLEILTGESEESLMPLLVARGHEVNALLEVILSESLGQPKKVGKDAK